MGNLSIEPTKTAQWQLLVTEAQAHMGFLFDENLEHYLVLTLDRFTTENNLASTVIALDFSNSIEVLGQEGCSKLRAVGDQCLLLAGLFPERAQHKNVSIDYFIGMGRQAYYTLSALPSTATIDNKLFHKLSDNFINLTDVLFAMRGLAVRKYQ